MDYARFGDKIVQRPNRADPTVDWVEVPPEDYAFAEAMLIAEANRNDDLDGPPPLVTGIRRAPRNDEIAERLGLNADELAERLAEPDKNRGTRIRVPEEEFDSMMAELGLSPEEARARFRGTHWSG